MRKSCFVFMLSLAMTGVHLAATKALAEDAPQRVEVTAKKFAFEPAEITVKKGQPVDLILKSEDVDHGLKFRELKVDVKAKKGASGEVHFTPTQTGTFVGHCSVFCGAGHGSMSFKLHVVD
jgi:cytochrome c oxidase subunit II